jgi:hypothetical protein
MAKERPILFSAPMVRAILEGRKTQTRRIVKKFVPYGETILSVCPYGELGDRLWVREAWAAHGGWDDMKPSLIDFFPDTNIWYRADGERDGSAGIPNVRRGRWRSSMFMPRRASRILLEISDVRVQRLQEISAEGALAEGVASTEFWRPKDVEGKPFEDKWWDDCEFWSRYPQLAFRGLWESINGVGSWDANPWVWAISFSTASSEPQA